MKRIIAALVILTASASGQILDDGKPYDEAVGSVVWVCTLSSDWEEAQGSGVVVGDGLILTAYHVIGNDTLVWAHAAERQADGTVINRPAHYRSMDAGAMKCVVIAEDPKRDLALLKVKHGQKRGRPMALAAKNPSPGEAVFTIGSGSNVLFRYSGGNVRQVYADTALFAGREVQAGMIEVTVPINIGDSGGPVINRRGELVGVNSYIETDKIQVSKAIDVAEIRAFLAPHRGPGR